MSIRKLLDFWLKGEKSYRQKYIVLRNFSILCRKCEHLYFLQIKKTKGLTPRLAHLLIKVNHQPMFFGLLQNMASPNVSPCRSKTRLCSPVYKSNCACLGLVVVFVKGLWACCRLLNTFWAFGSSLALQLFFSSITDL